MTCKIEPASHAGMVAMNSIGILFDNGRLDPADYADLLVEIEKLLIKQGINPDQVGIKGANGLIG